MSDLKKSVNDLNQMIQHGQALEAFEKYYDEKCVMQENDSEPRVGKTENRNFEKAFVENVTEWRKADVVNVGIGDNVTFVHWDFDFTHQDWGERKYSQVSVQTWKNGKIVHEKFIYNA